MTKLSKQQHRRITKNQQLAQDKIKYSDSFQHATVITRFSNQAAIQPDGQAPVIASIKRQLTDLVAGDRVVFEKVADDYMVCATQERKTVLGRPNRKGEIKAIAANVDFVFIVTAPKPEPSTLMIDSYLLACHALQLMPVIILNKSDVASLQEIQALYQSLGYLVISTSTVNNANIEQLSEHLNDKIGVFVGQSGVGKSSLINALLPEANATTQEISAHISLGKHTTSTSNLYFLKNGYSAIIDSPGIRAFNLWPMEKQIIMNGFIELADLSKQCKFKNCRHKDDPGCAIQKALTDKTIAISRYQSLMHILESYQLK